MNFIPNIKSDALLNDIKSKIEESKTLVAVTANSTTTLLYWSIGHSINNEIL